jgi:hypothetical protein
MARIAVAATTPAPSPLAVKTGCHGVYLRLETGGGSRSRLDGERDRARARPTRDLEIDLSGRNT